MSRRMMLPALVTSLVIFSGSYAVAAPTSLFDLFFGSRTVRSCNPCDPIEPCVAVKACEKVAPAACEKVTPAACEKVTPPACERVAPVACEKVAPAACEQTALPILPLFLR